MKVPVNDSVSITKADVPELTRYLTNLCSADVEDDVLGLIRNLKRLLNWALIFTGVLNKKRSSFI